MSKQHLSLLSVPLLCVFIRPALAEIKGYDDNLSDSTLAVVVDIDPVTGAASIPPEYAACPAAPNPPNTVFRVGFTSGFAFAPSIPGSADDTLFGLEFEGTLVFLYRLASISCAQGMRVGTAPVGFPLLESLTYCCTDGFLYSVSFDDQAHEGQLIRIDPNTGIGTPVSEHRMARDVWVVGLVYDPSSGSFYAITNGFADRDIQELYTINMNGVETLVGPTGTNPQELQSLVMDDSGQLFAAGTQLYGINPITGAAAAVDGNSFTGTVWAMAYPSMGCPPPPTPTPPNLTPPATPTWTPTDTPTSTPTDSPTRRPTTNGRTPTKTRTPASTSTVTETPRRISVTTIEDILIADTVIRVDDVRFLPLQGLMQIGEEIIRYFGIELFSGGSTFGTGQGSPQPGQLLNVERGVNGTVPALHPAGTTLVLLSTPCAGDCDGNGEVTINELVTGVNIALGSALVADCPSLDVNVDGEVAINELISAVNNALDGCS